MGIRTVGKANSFRLLIGHVCPVEIVHVVKRPRKKLRLGEMKCALWKALRRHGDKITQGNGRRRGERKGQNCRKVWEASVR